MSFRTQFDAERHKTLLRKCKSSKLDVRSYVIAGGEIEMLQFFFIAIVNDIFHCKQRSYPRKKVLTLASRIFLHNFSQ